VTEPLFQVVRGDPTPEELAALTAVLAARAHAAEAATSRRHLGPPPWGTPAAHHRHPLPPPGPGAWRGLWTAAGTEFPPSATLPVGGPFTLGWGSGVAGVARGAEGPGAARGAEGPGAADA
jgi:Acyl-CoA carboxylase epsilon subunit